jgi:ABC-type sugar transport system ATPase subunit
MDILGGAFARIDDETWYRVGDVAFRVPSVIADRVAGQDVDLGIRPEHVRLGPGGVEATVRVVQPLGPVTILTLAWPGGSLTARLPGITRLETGQLVSMHLDPEHILLFDRGTGLLLD